jgi:hypothetical protein
MKLNAVSRIKNRIIVFQTSLFSDKVFDIYLFRLVLRKTEYTKFCYIVPNVFVYDTLRVLARKLANKNRIENPQGFS